MLIRMGLMLGCVLAVWGGRCDAGVAMDDHVTVRANFAQGADYPLTKTKFGVYNSGFVPGDVMTYKRDAHLFDEVHPDTLRFDGGLGSPRGILLSRPRMISGRSPDFSYDFRQADELIDLLRSHNVQPYWCYSYIPEVIARSGSFANPPENLADWGAIVGAVAKHFRESGHPVDFHEIYNEPDNRDFLVGTCDDYLALYETAAKAIRAADPEALIGGPSVAFTDSWIDPFLRHVLKNKLPLDFYSFHFYPGVPYKATTVQGVVETMRRELGKHREFETTEMHLNEYNSLTINYPPDGPQQKHRLAAMLLRDYAYFITQPCLTQINWAQFMDTGGGNWSGMVSIDGHRKAVFNAYKLYAMMPVDRCAVSVQGPAGLESMASSDGHKSALIVWNLSGAKQRASLTLGGLPFESGTLRVYRIDAEHASWGDNPADEDLIPTETRAFEGKDDPGWAGNIPDGGAVYLEAMGVKIASPALGGLPKVLRVLHYFPNRESRAYADFDRNTWNFRLGMAGEQSAEATVGATTVEMPQRLSFETRVDGKLTRIDTNSLLGVRLDYRVKGEYVSSVLFHGPCGGSADLYRASRTSSVPWGTKRRTDKAIAVPNLAHFTVDPSTYAPKNWDGGLLISSTLQNAGPTVRVRISMTSAAPKAR